MKKRLKDIRVRKKVIKPYMIKIYSNMLNTWFHDLYDNLPDHEPRYWHVFIGTNNKYGVALPLNDKKASSIHNTLEEFINTYHPAKLTSDEEPYIDIIPASYLRGAVPTRMSKLEKEFFDT